MRDRLSPTAEQYAVIARVALVAFTLIVLTGAAVRVTGSGLGCPTWPKCTDSALYTELKLHGVIEFGNRLLTSVVGVRGARSVRRRDPPPAAPARPRRAVGAAAGRRARADRARRLHRPVRPRARFRDEPLPALDADPRRLRRARLARASRARRARCRPSRRPAADARRMVARPDRGDHDLRRHGGDRGRPARRRRRHRRHHQAAALQGCRHAELRRRAARPAGDAAWHRRRRAVDPRLASRRDAARPACR